MNFRIKGKLILLPIMLLSPILNAQQVAEQGLPPAANTLRSYQDASISRDSGNYQPLDLLNNFYPSIEVTLAKSDNIRRQSDTPEEDVRLTVSPALAYRSSLGRHSFYAAYEGNFRYHEDFEQEDGESHRLDARLGLDLTRRWDLELFAGLGTALEERGVSGSRDFLTFANRGRGSSPDQVDFYSYGGDLIFGRKIGIIRGVLGYDYTATRFDSTLLAGEFNFEDSRDRESESVHFDVDWKFADRTSLFGRIQRTETSYDRVDTGLDSTQVDFYLGLRWRASGALSGSVAVGATERDFESPSREDFEGSTYYANLNYAINPFSTIGVSASRALEEPADALADFYESDFIGVSWNHAFSPRVTFNAYAKFIDDTYNSTRRDDFFDWGVGLGYIWRDWLTAGIYYGEIERTSSFDEISYAETYYGLRISSDLRNLFGGRNKDGKLDPPYSYGEPTKTSQSRSSK